MGLVEGVVGEVENLIVNGLGNLLGDAVFDGAGDVPVRIAVDKGPAFRHDDVLLLLGNGPAHIVGLAQAEAAQPPEDFNDLLLVDDAAIGDLQNRL